MELWVFTSGTFPLWRRYLRAACRYLLRPLGFFVGWALSWLTFHFLFCLCNPRWWRRRVIDGVLYVVRATVSFSRQWLFESEAEADMYEMSRLQPFAIGGYLRCMLVSGFASLLFNFYSWVLWPEFPQAASFSCDIAGGNSGSCTAGVALEKEKHSSHVWGLSPQAFEKVLQSWLFAQIALNVLQLVPRVILHLRCWEASRAIEVDTAIGVIRHMVQSDAWAINRLLGRASGLVSVMSLWVCELYLWTSGDAGSPTRSVMLSLVSTNVLAFLVRIVTATALAVSAQDPAVLAEARRRGLTKWDIDLLPTQVFSSRADCSSRDCSICLCDFDLGEMVMSLPCEGDHSFHAICIRQWLECQNSCPLCQRMV